MTEEERGFVIRDKRGRTEHPGDAPPSAPPPKPELQPSDELKTDVHQPGPPVTFSSFVFSLGTSVLMLLGETLDPNHPPGPVNLPQAKEIIEILSMLEEKTKGNLSTEEASVLRDMLYTLRMKFVSLTPGKQ